MPTLDLTAPPTAFSGTPFAATIDLTGARPGTEVTISLRQTRRGLPPLYAAQKTVTTSADGSAAVDFEVTLTGKPGTTLSAVLLATGNDANLDFYAPDAEVVRVS